MQFATSRWLPALVMQWLKLVKTLVLPATKVPTRMENAMLTDTARMPHTSPAAAWPGFAVPPARPRVRAATPMAAATMPASRPSGRSTNDNAATRLATPRTRAAVPRPFFDLTDGDITEGVGDPMLTMASLSRAWPGRLCSGHAVGMPHRRHRPYDHFYARSEGNERVKPVWERPAACKAALTRIRQLTVAGVADACRAALTISSTSSRVGPAASRGASRSRRARGPLLGRGVAR